MWASQDAESDHVAVDSVPDGPEPRGARIRLTGWTYRYPGRATAALRGIDLQIEPGELVVVLGASGSGKSTLLAALAETLPEGERAGELEVTADGGRARIGLVAQDAQSNVVMETVGDDLAFPLENCAVPRDEIWARVAAARELAGLTPPLDRSTTSLSGGQLQLLAVAAASIADPHLLLLDEPTANLDEQAATQVVAAVEAERARTGCTVVVIEHRVAPWLAGADRVLLVADGTAMSVPPHRLAEELAGRPELARRVWLDRSDLPTLRPRAAAGDVTLSARGVAVTGRLAPVDLDCHAGEIVAVTGDPGSGKSTLLACLAGLHRPDQGTVRTADGTADPWSWPASAVAETFGVVFQNPEHQFLTSSVRAELEHGRNATDPRVRARVDELLERLHLGSLADADPFTLSGGEQRRLSVGTALAAGPEVLLLDEPTFGQDPTTWRELVAILAEHRDGGGSAVIATHDPHLVTALGAREVRLESAEAGWRSTPGGPARLGSDALPPGRGLRGFDQLALLATAALLSIAALLSASVGLNVALAAAAAVAALVGGLPARRVGLLAVPALIATASVALSNALLGEHGLLSLQSWQAAALPASRILAVSLPGLVAAVAIDPTGLADALTTRARVPARPAYSVLAGLRLLPLLSEEWTILSRASRARGIGGRGIVRRVRTFLSMTFRLLVSALRRAGRLALALDLRGLTSDGARTVARPIRWRARDTVAIVAGLAILVLALSTRW